MDVAEREYRLLVASGRLPEMPGAAGDRVRALLGRLPDCADDIADVVSAIHETAESAGHESGYAAGYEDGEAEGIKQGIADGLAQAREEAEEAKRKEGDRDDGDAG